MRAWHPLTPSWMPLLAVWFGVVLLPEEYLDLVILGDSFPRVSVFCNHTFRVKVDSDPEVDSWTVFGVSTVRCTGYSGFAGR